MTTQRTRTYVKKHCYWDGTDITQHDVLYTIFTWSFILIASLTCVHNLQKLRSDNNAQYSYDISSWGKQSLRIVVRASMLCASERCLRAWEKTKNEWGTDATDSFPAKWRLRNDCRSSILTTHHYSDLSSASDWWKICLSNHKLYPNLGSDASSVGNFSTRFSDVILRANVG